MVHFLRGAASVVLLACLSSAVSAVDFGRTAGSFSVSGGSANYTIPIWTPPGPNGVQPSIAISYDSQSGNGVGGVGWSLAAVSSIARCPRTVGQDGATAAVTLTTSDRFCIGGNRMRLFSGTYGSAGSVYYTEIADYSRITAFGTAGSGPQYFVVEAKSGLKYEYGNTTDSRVFPGVSPGPISTTPSQWMLNKVYDRNGNKYVISYNNSGGFAVPDVISWTPTSLGASTYRYDAKFNYTTTRTDLDSYLGKIATYDVANRFRLENIQIKNSSVVKRKYRFAYDTSTVTSRSRMTSAKECSDDAETNCLLPITFSYQAGIAGIAAGGGTPPAGSSNSIIAGRYDFNGDGKDDIAYWSGSSWNVAFSTNSGFSSPYSTGITGSVLVDNFLPTGRASFLTSVSGVLWTYRWDDATSTFVGNNTGTASALPSASLDFTGDGLADLVYFTSGSNSLSVRYNTTTGTGNPSFGSAFATATLGPNLIYGGVFSFGYNNIGFPRADINGDHTQDLNVLIVTTGMGGGSTYSTVLLGNSGGFSVPLQSQWVLSGSPVYPAMNFNGDKCADRFVGTTVLVSACNGVAGTSITAPASPLLLMDWDGDGKTDLIVNNGGTLGVYRSTGAGFSSLISTSIPACGAGACFALDQDGDGLDDLIKINGTSAVNYWTHTSGGVVPTYATNVPDLLSSAVDGFGVTNSPNYVSTGWYNYSVGTATALPLQEADPSIVVALTTNSDGVGGNYTKSYSYVGARVDSSRESFVGYQRIDETDSRNGLISRLYFDQAFPVSGMVSQQELMQPNGMTSISRTVLANLYATLDSTTNNQRYFPYPQTITATQYEVAGTWNGSLLRTVVTSNTVDSGSGEFYDQTVTTTEPASGANGLTAGGSWSERTYTPLANLTNDSTNWCLGQRGQVQKINSHNLTYGTQITRTTNVTWNAAFCRPTQMQAEPGNTSLQVTTDIGYDSFGNVSSTTVTGYGMTARTTSSTYSDATFTTGQFPLTATNALGQTSTSAWNYDLGVPTSATDPNGISVSWQYDAFGRRNREDRPDGTATTWTFNNCTSVSGGCVSTNNKTVVIQTALASGGAYVNDLWTYLDGFDRSMITTTRTMGGSYNRIERQYDALGRVYRDSAPCIWVGCTQYWTTNSYDLANRVTSVTRPRSDSDSTLVSTTISYEGLTTRTTDELSKQSIKVQNAAGQMRQSKDHDGYYQTFEYDAFGNIKAVTDSASNTLQSSVYNLRGMLTQRTDMDMGTWNFTPDPLGEVVTQIDAKSQSTSFVFDLLGRLTSRTEAEGTSTWTWGTSATAKNIGSLASVSETGYSETYTYDSIGRRSSTSVGADTSYQIDYTYNPIGALDTLTYPTSTSSYRLKLQYDYQYGQLFRVKDYNATSTVFWTAAAVNGRNQITQESLGNGLVTNRAFDAVTGWLKTIQTGIGGGTGVQNLAYSWNDVGSLASRKDVNQSNLTETFIYDNLHRLDYSQLNGVTNLDVGYDQLGNISSKLDVGTYTYDATKKHQVASTSTGWSFGYDNNGNMTSGRGATITWTSYNYVSQINQGGLLTSFYYTPDRRYFKQVADYSNGTATTMYIGGILEKVTTSAGTDYRHMIRVGGATIIVSRQSSGTNATNYVTTDHLGSSSAITNSSGGILVNSSFSAFGARRGSNWSGTPSAGDWTAFASTTRRGFTDHSMLDNIGLIQMNGRVQDPLLGRFASADPYITEPGFTQNYNRYSYLYNNPLSFTDPSGFCGKTNSNSTSTNTTSGTKTDGLKNGSSESEGCDQMPEVVVTAHQCDDSCQQIVNEVLALQDAYIKTLNLGELLARTIDALGIDGGAQEKNRQEKKEETKKCWAAGLNLELSTINPFTSGGGGSYGLNFEWTAGNGLAIYTYGTPKDTASQGFLLGPSATLNVATGKGPWTGRFDSAAGSFGLATGGAFWSSPGDDDPGYFGLQAGVGKGPPGVGTTTTNYTKRGQITHPAPNNCTG